jgi:hypothetical protein
MIDDEDDTWNDWELVVDEETHVPPTIAEEGEGMIDDEDDTWVDWELVDDEETRVPPTIAEEVDHAPPELDCKRLEWRDPVTQGRRAWGWTSHDDVLIMKDDGTIFIRWDETTTTFNFDLTDPAFSRLPKGRAESFEEQQDRISMLLSKLKHARVIANLRNRLERWIHASRLGHWLRTR